MTPAAITALSTCMLLAAVSLVVVLHNLCNGKRRRARAKPGHPPNRA